MLAMWKNCFCFILLSFFMNSCKKGWLDIRSNKKIVTPSSINDYQAIMDNVFYLNEGMFGLQALGETGTDNFYFSVTTWNTLVPTIKNAYVFKEDIFEGQKTIFEWNDPYRRVFYANVVLDDIEKVSFGNNQENEWKNVKGSALFVRGHSFFWLAQIYAMPYNALTADTDLGIGVRLTSNVNETTKRWSVAKSYEQILKDLKEALTLLPEISLKPTRPSKAGASALLARVYLSMNNYDSAWKYANESLKIKKDMMDYNQLDKNLTYPIPQFNVEVIYSDVSPSSQFQPSMSRVDSNLYKAYAEDDLRKTIFFKKNSSWNTFNGGYNGDFQFFGGITTPEMYLTRAECYARKGNVTEAINDLHTLLRKRWKSSVQFPLIEASSSSEAVEKVLLERRKELCFKGLRWVDIRRLNTLGANIYVQRVLNNIPYELTPNSPKYAFPIPDVVVQFNGMMQNTR